MQKQKQYKMSLDLSPGNSVLENELDEGAFHVAKGQILLDFKVFCGLATINIESIKQLSWGYTLNSIQTTEKVRAILTLTGKDWIEVADQKKGGRPT